MKKIVLLFTITLSLFVNATDLNTILGNLESYMEQNYFNSHNGAMGIEYITDGKPISQANMVFDLERSLENDPGFCLYSTNKDTDENIEIMGMLHNEKAAEAIQKLDDLGQIAHISLRMDTEGESDLCYYAYYRIVLKNGSMIWFDFDFTK